MLRPKAVSEEWKQIESYINTMNSLSLEKKIDYLRKNPNATPSGCINRLPELEAELHSKNFQIQLAEAEKQIQLTTDQHIEMLALNKMKTVFKDEYGIDVFDRWFQAQDYFINNVLRKNHLLSTCLSSPSADFYRSRARSIIENSVNKYNITKKSENNAHQSVDVDSLSPIEFEHHCADILSRCGWNARVTQAAGDQGIDVIATRENVKVVLQCKKYSQPVGNASVQEIIAGKHYEKADIACVVSNNTYTPSAKQLANSTGVYLLHYTELTQLVEKIGMK